MLKLCYQTKLNLTLYWQFLHNKSSDYTVQDDVLATSLFTIITYGSTMHHPSNHGSHA
jgi:hypothetical protein